MFFHYLTLSFILYKVIHNLNAIKNNTFELNKNIILEIFDSNFRALFRETYIRLDYKQRETCSETFFRKVFLKTLKKKENLDYWSIISEFINGNKNEKTVFLLYFLEKNKKKYRSTWKKKFGKGCAIWAYLIFTFFPAAQPWWTTLSGIPFRIFVPVS